MTITVETQGRRHYLVGDTYQVKDRLRAAGAKWDADRRAWWTGKREIAAEIAAEVGQSGGGPSPAKAEGRANESISDDSVVTGKALYKGKQYLLLWEGETKRGRAAKLAFLDGSSVFWADAGGVQVLKRYQARQDRYGRAEKMTFGRLQLLRERYAEAKAQGNEDGIRDGQRYECEECGEWVTRGQGSCWETGCAH